MKRAALLQVSAPDEFLASDMGQTVMGSVTLDTRQRFAAALFLMDREVS